MRGLVAAMLVAASLWVLETARAGVGINRTMIGETPVMVFAAPDAEGPAIVIAHGFAGSSQMMQGYALPLAQAGYRVYAFDFLGHGRHRLPMSGDVNAVDGTTRLLVAQTLEVIDAVATDQPVGLLGHSMATDILVRVAQEREVGPMVLLSAFSKEVTSKAPDNLLLLVGAWEPGLREFAVEAAETAAETTRRQAFVLPMIEHVSILQSRAGQAAALAWFDRGLGSQLPVPIHPTGPALVGLFVGLVLLFGGLARRLPHQTVPAIQWTRRQCALVLLLPMIATPPLAVLLDPGLMPVLVADYLALHLMIYGALQLGLQKALRVPLGGFDATGFALLVLGCAVFGVALDRYAANFWPVGSRWWIIAAMSLGAVLFFVADARLSHDASRLNRLLIRFAFLASLIIAVMIDFEGLFFLLMIAPVIVLFYLIFGTMGHAVSNRAGPLAAGLALGLMLAWSLGVSFPMFQG